MCSKLSRLRHAQAVEQRQDHQRGQPLRRRRRIVERAGADRDAERLGDARVVFLEIGARHRAADALQIGGDLAADIAAIEIVEPGIGEMFERGGEGGLLERAPTSGALPSTRNALRKPGAVSSSAYFSTVSRAWLRVTV